jgi:hypothetical protein
MTIETQSGLVASSRHYLDGLKPWQRRLVYGLALIVAWPIVMTLVYTAIPPPFSNLMILRLSPATAFKDCKSQQMSPVGQGRHHLEDARFASIMV